jgi:hypothetical protein
MEYGLLLVCAIPIALLFAVCAIAACMRSSQISQELEGFEQEQPVGYRVTERGYEVVNG